MRFSTIELGCLGESPITLSYPDAYWMLARALFTVRMAIGTFAPIAQESVETVVRLRPLASMWPEPRPGALAELFLQRGKAGGTLIVLAANYAPADLPRVEAPSVLGVDSDRVVAEIRKRLLRWSEGSLGVASILFYAAAASTSHPFWLPEFKAGQRRKEVSLSR